MFIAEVRRARFGPGPRRQAHWVGRASREGMLVTAPEAVVADCFIACANRSPHGPLVHIWSADPQPSDYQLGKWLVMLP